MPLQPGTRLGNYEILSELGSGGMGEVYKARDVKLGRNVAIKVLPQEMASDTQRLRRFEQEARAASALNHPNIVTIYEIGEHEGAPYIAMEYVEGKTLREILSNGPLPNDKLIRWATQMAEGLAKAHEVGIVHRDLKPENVVIREDGYLKILDFGLAKLLPQERIGSEVMTAANEGTTPGTILGTVGYMSPEQAKGERATFQSDLFSLGSIIFEMATGHRAFPGSSSVHALYAIIEKAPDPIASFNPLVPPLLQAVVAKCLAKRPDDRYSSTQTLVRDFYRLAEDSSARDQAGRVGAQTKRVKAIAVLPLVDLRPLPGEEYFVDGLTEALITNLAKIGAWKVISRTSAMRYKGTDKTLREIAQELGVDAILEGSLLRAGERLRLTAQLILAHTDEHLWAETYDRALRDILTLQGELARAIADQIQIHITPRESERLARAHPVDPKAYEAYLKGRFYWNKRTEEGFRRGIELFQQSIEQDPSYPLAYAGLADSYTLLGNYGHVPTSETGPRAKAAAIRALELDEHSAEALTSLGRVKHTYDWEWMEAEQHFKHAILQDPNYATAHQWYAFYLSTMERFEEAVAQIQKARELDPLSTIISAGVGRQLYFAGRYQSALEEFQRALALEPQAAWVHWAMGLTYQQMGMLNEALTVLGQAESLIGDHPWVQASQGNILASLGERGRALELLRQLTSRSRRRPVSWEISLIHAALGDRAAALTWLERAYDERHTWMSWIKVEPRFSSLRSDPRFQDLLRRMNLLPLRLGVRPTPSKKSGGV